MAHRLRFKHFYFRNEGHRGSQGGHKGVTEVHRGVAGSHKGSQEGHRSNRGKNFVFRFCLYLALALVILESYFISPGREILETFFSFVTISLQTRSIWGFHTHNHIEQVIPGVIMTIAVTFDAGTSDSKIIARYRSVEYPFDVVERYFVVSPFVRVLTPHTYRSQLEYAQDAMGTAGVLSYIDPSNNEQVYWEVGETAARPGLLPVGNRKFETLLAKILGFLGYLITLEIDKSDVIELDLGILLPLDEIGDRKILAQWLRRILQVNVGFKYNGTSITHVQLRKINCKPEGYGVFKQYSSDKNTGVLVIGHSDSSWLYFERGMLNNKLSTTLPETGMHDFIKELSFPISYERTAAKVLAEAGSSLNPKVLAELTQTKKEFEIQQLQQAIVEAKPQYWASRRVQMKFLEQMKVEQVLVSGGTSHYFAKELNELFKDLFGLPVNTCTSLMKEFSERFQLTKKSYLPYRFADCFGYYKTLITQSSQNQLLETRS